MVRSEADTMNGNGEGNIGGASYFAAANTSGGFVSFFDTVFFSNDIERRYIIKGGPGTGKSSLLRKVAGYAEGRGHCVVYYYCSSDTASLDGIVIDGKIALLDGTAPHSCDTVLPGACDEIINLGAFWNSSALGGRVGEIKTLGREKGRAYASAYGYLRAAGELAVTVREQISECVLKDKLRAAVRRTADKLSFSHKVGDKEILRRQVSAIGTRGRVRLCTLEDMAKNTHVLLDHYGTAGLYMKELLGLAIAEGQRVWVSFDLIEPDVPEELYFPESGDYFRVSFADSNESERAEFINMKRFVDADRFGEIRQLCRTAQKTYRTALDLALYELGRAGALHAELERIYVGSMDFEALQKYVGQLEERLF
jgi:hypothetical protein